MNNNYPPEEPTLPAEQFRYYQQQQANNRQGQQPERRPYQFPGADKREPAPPLSSQQQSPYGQTSREYPQQQGAYGQRVQPGGYAGAQGRQGYPRQDDIPAYSPTRPGSSYGSGPGAQPMQRPRKKRGCMIGCLGSLLILLILGIFLFTTLQKVLAFGSAISNQSPLSSQTGYMGGSSRINILMMGYGGSGHDGAYLTDSMVIMSLLPQSHHTTLISVPRDLWVQNPANSGNYSKLNAVYPVAAGDTNANPIAGGNAAAQKIALITGLQINYWITINFTGFKDFIDAIGGVDVNVPDAFNACYPKNDDATVDPSWIKVQFNPGVQHMDGATAIEYARAREPLEICGLGTSENQAELTDFGRSQRQQIIMKAALTKLKDWRTWPSLVNGMDKLKQTLYSNLSLADLSEFALKMDLNGAHHVGLSNANVLVDSAAGGQYILAPRNGDWSQIPPYIQQQLYN